MSSALMRRFEKRQAEEAKLAVARRPAGPVAAPAAAAAVLGGRGGGLVSGINLASCRVLTWLVQVLI